MSIRTPDGATWMRIDLAAERHSVDERTIRKWIQRGRVASFPMHGGKVWVRCDDVADMELLNYRRRAHDTPA